MGVWGVVRGVVRGGVGAGLGSVYLCPKQQSAKSAERSQKINILEHGKRSLH